jgi:hypothetical protein
MAPPGKTFYTRENVDKLRARLHHLPPFTDEEWKEWERRFSRPLPPAALKEILEGWQARSETNGRTPIEALLSEVPAFDRLPSGVKSELLKQWYERHILTQVATYRQLKLYAKINRKTFNSKPAAVTA